MATPSKKTMFNYFTKLPSKTSIVENENPRKSAPMLNKQHVEEFQARLKLFDELIFSNESIENQKVATDYFKSIKNDDYKPYKYRRKVRGPLRARLLQFQEDVRPPYFGTWQKTSKSVTGRRPTSLDNDVFDYDVDSEAEWDIGGPGESLKGDDSEDEEELDDYEIDMKTFVPHGYVSDDELENSDNEQNSSSKEEPKPSKKTVDIEDSDSDIKIIVDTRPVSEQKATRPTQPPAPAPSAKQTPKMDIKAITLGLSYEDNPTISEAKIQFLKAFQGLPCK